MFAVGWQKLGTFEEWWLQRKARGVERPPGFKPNI